MKSDESFGVIPLSKTSGQWEVFLIQHHKGRHWGFPKGHAEIGESPLDAALRELKEETNLDCVQLLRTDPFMEQYQFFIKGERVSKQVSYFAAEVEGTVKLQEKEISNGVWCSLSDAIHKMTYSEGKSILSKVMQMLCIA